MTETAQPSTASVSRPWVIATVVVIVGAGYVWGLLSDGGEDLAGLGVFLFVVAALFAVVFARRNRPMVIGLSIVALLGAALALTQLFL